MGEQVIFNEAFKQTPIYKARKKNESQTKKAISKLRAKASSSSIFFSKVLETASSSFRRFPKRWQQADCKLSREMDRKYDVLCHKI